MWWVRREENLAPSVLKIDIFENQTVDLCTTAGHELHTYLTFQHYKRSPEVLVTPIVGLKITRTSCSNWHSYTRGLLFLCHTTRLQARFGLYWDTSTILRNWGRKPTFPILDGQRWVMSRKSWLIALYDLITILVTYIWVKLPVIGRYLNSTWYSDRNWPACLQ